MKNVIYNNWEFIQVKSLICKSQYIPFAQKLTRYAHIRLGLSYQVVLETSIYTPMYNFVCIYSYRKNIRIISYFNSMCWYDLIKERLFGNL